jgi:hypothetical protein
MTGYGKIDLIWIDQFPNKYTYSAWPSIREHIKSHQPQCLVIGNNANNFEKSDILGYEYSYWMRKDPIKALPPSDNTKPSGVCDQIGPRWFWSTKENYGNLKPAEDIVKLSIPEQYLHSKTAYFPILKTDFMGEAVSM